MNERLVEDWLTKANERSYQTPFSQALLADGMEVLRVAHSPHEHGKDVIAVDKAGKVHAYQLKDGDLGLKDFEKEFGQITALVETQVEHPAISGQPRHQPWLVVSGDISVPVEDRIRVHNINWKKRGYRPLKVITGRQLLAKFLPMTLNFWPQLPEDSRTVFNLYLTDGTGSLDRQALARLLRSILDGGETKSSMDLARRIAAANLFASYSVSPFYTSQNYWELVQGWTITAAQIAWSAEQANLPEKHWRTSFRLAVDEALVAINALAMEALQPDALRARGFELDELTRCRCTISAAAVAANLLIKRYTGEDWNARDEAAALIIRLSSQGRLILWGESAIPLFLTIVWALDEVRPDRSADVVLFSILSVVARQNSNHLGPKLPAPYDSADEANVIALERLLKGHRKLEVQATASYSLETLVAVFARRMWRQSLASVWSSITKVDLVRLVPDVPRDLLLWNWRHERGENQSRRFPPTQSWAELLAESRRDEKDRLPKTIRSEFDFMLLFVLCFPHRLSPALAKYVEQTLGFLKP